MPDAVRVTYHGVVLEEAAEMRQVAPASAFVVMPQPMPVGTDLELVHEAWLFPARVLRVGVDGEDPGVIVRVGHPDDDARDWWSQRVTRDDHEIPEPPQA